MWGALGTLGRAVLSWLIPFMISCTLFDPQGRLVVDVQVFKALMMALFSITCAGLLRKELCSPRAPRPPRPLLPYAARIGAIYLAVNLALDVAILVPLARAQARLRGDAPMTLTDWMVKIAIGYVAVLAQALLAGAVSDFHTVSGATVATIKSK